ncbi:MULTISPECIES: nitronate monooxygenase family protein [unclassified Azospirillum]|uniref:NAD(P)H-dependent flavin oxidoreductase n=1 Tax=unclassified Azospirillum TaxID=2630922 RepID=UPI000B6E159D|nr:MULTISPECIES: nitronate monooxygenase [unclassified Azospirillum]SNT08821.1 nitronate monooxygenase [Azospirillum sp. RU38E]SNT23162.1 nitronate monooxygenase [Azospirillum sp. RU37A]
MSLPENIRRKLVLPVFCAPMFLVSTPALVREACLAGLIGGLPRQNARSLEQFGAWLAEIDAARRQAREQGRPEGVLAVNLASNLPAEEMAANLALCRQYGVEIIVNATGNPTELTRRAHGEGMLVYADAINLRFAEKAMVAGVDGITAIGWGGGGHSGTISPLALVPQLRRMFDGTLLLAGAVSSGGAVRAAEMLGADLAYLGTRFIATAESGASDDYKSMLVTGAADDVLYTASIAGIAANWLTPSLRRAGLDPAALPPPPTGPGHAHLPEGARPWRTLWSAGQGIALIQDIPAVADLVARLQAEYRAACALPAFPASRPGLGGV